ncbi:hypothetical protein LVJ94_39030 [Pendulispora rubella]|uniref:Anti-sigma factor n=1 Tax=Pendulispora rubella TaxID=2741070 RepID=A0ABZ2KW22_9BACT
MSAAEGAHPFGEEAMLDLMAYADGELEGAAAERVAAWVARDAEAARLVEEFRTLSECIAVSEAARPVPKAVDRIVDDVMVKATRYEVDRKPNADPKPIRLRRAVVAGTVSAALALAASWFMFFRAPDFPDAPAPQTAANTPAAPATEPEAPATEPSAVAAAAPETEVTPGGVELEQVESPSREISVFYVPTVSGESGSSIVVWIGDNKPGTK